MKGHKFTGKWITTEEFEQLKPRNVFHRQLDTSQTFEEEHTNRHILFRKKFDVKERFEKAILYITADDYYKLYVNGSFVTQGPAPAYPFSYGYNVVDISSFLKEGQNIIAIHTYYQGMINRVWVSGDNRHGLLCDLEIDGQICISSDESFLAHIHLGYQGIGTAGYKTQFLEEYNSNAKEKNFTELTFDDTDWENSKVRRFVDYSLKQQDTKQLDFEKIVTDISPETGLRTADIENLSARDRSDSRILIAEDSPLLSKLITDCLKKAGYQDLIVTNNGQEAWDKICELKQKGSLLDDVQCIITDIEMPQMDGHRLTKLCKSDDLIKKIPLVIFSSLVNEEMRRKGEQLGADAQLTKPEIGMLVDAIDRLIAEAGI